MGLLERNMKKKLLREGPYADFFSQGVQTGNILTLACQLGDDSEGNVPNGLQSQMENCYKNIEIILKELLQLLRFFPHYIVLYHV